MGIIINSKEFRKLKKRNRPIPKGKRSIKSTFKRRSGKFWSIKDCMESDENIWQRCNIKAIEFINWKSIGFCLVTEEVGISWLYYVKIDIVVQTKNINFVMRYY